MLNSRTNVLRREATNPPCTTLPVPAVSVFSLGGNGLTSIICKTNSQLLSIVVGAWSSQPDANPVESKRETQGDGLKSNEQSNVGEMQMLTAEASGTKGIASRKQPRLTPSVKSDYCDGVWLESGHKTKPMNSMPRKSGNAMYDWCNNTLLSYCGNLGRTYYAWLDERKRKWQCLLEYILTRVLSTCTLTWPFVMWRKRKKSSSGQQKLHLLLVCE
jgi:hypothetical protein